MTPSPHDRAPRAQTVAVTGATGFVGRNVVQALLSRGHTVRALVRNPDRARETLPATASLIVVRGDALERDAMARLADGADAMIHLIGIRRERPGGVTYRRLHVDAARIALEAAGEAGAGRFVHMSALGARADAPARYHRTKFEGERLVRRSGLRWTIFRPSIIHGPGGEFMELVRAWVLGDAPPYRFLPYFFRTDPVTGEARSGLVQPVAVEDVAAAFVHALTNPRAVGEVYALGGPERWDWPRLLTAVQSLMPDANPKLAPRGLSGVFASRVAQVARALGLDQALPFGPDEPLMAIEDSVCALDKPREHLGFDPRGFRETVAAYAARL